MSYLTHLTVRLAQGVTNWSEEFRRPHAKYLLEQQATDGGFAGRQGASDLYYTSFGLRALALLGAIDESVADRVSHFLQTQLDVELPSVERFSLIFSVATLNMAAGVDLLDDERKIQFAAQIEDYRRDDGGFAKSPSQSTGSTYHTFLAVLAKGALGFELGATERLVDFIDSQRCEDGGYAEIPQARISGTNPTAAAVVLLAELGRLDEVSRSGAVRFFSEMQNTEGGFRANSRIPLADGLSTFTALAALAELDALSEIDLRAAATFVKNLERPNGGFGGGLWDTEADVEYTFYALGTLALAGV